MSWQDGSWEYCLIYRGRLPGGRMSPGYVDSGSDNRPGAYVCRKVDWEDRNVGGPTSEVPANLTDFGGNTAASEETWASKYVRYVRIDNPVGMSSDAINKGYDILLPAPYGSSNHGVLTKRPGSLPPVTSVPDGATNYDRKLMSLTDRNVPVMERARAARELYGDSLAPAEGAPYPDGQYEFPSPKEQWL